MVQRLSPLILFLVIPLFACNKSADPQTASRDLILAQVNGKPITVDAFNRKWSMLPEMVKTAYFGQSGKKDFLEELIRRELLLQKAHEMNLDQDRPFKDRVEAFRERLLLDAVLNKTIEEKVVVTDGEIDAYFNAHRDTLPPIEEVRASHILVKTEAEAKTLLDKLHRGADFSVVARTNSIDPGTKDKGGDLGTVRKGRMVAEFEKALFALKPGQTSEAVKTPYGYHIIRVQSRRAFKPTRVDDTRNEIRQELIKDKEKALFDDLIKTLRAEARIVLSDPFPASIEKDARER